jgi:hypothetical protein
VGERRLDFVHHHEGVAEQAAQQHRVVVGQGRRQARVEELDPRAGLALLRRRGGPLQNGLEGLRARGTHEQREHESGECGGTAHERRFGRRPAPHEWGSPPGGPGPVGPPQLLALLESATLRDEVAQREGDLV